MTPGARGGSGQPIQKATGLDAQSRGEHVLAAEHAERARGLAVGMGDARRAARASALLALNLWRQGYPERAVHICLEALADIDQTLTERESIEVRMTLTMAYVDLEMSSDALPHAIDALRRARALDDADAIG
jgi:hypothetical protein